MFIHRNQGVIRVIRELQFDLPTSQPLLTLLASSPEALTSIGITEAAISRLIPKENLASFYRFYALVYPETVIGHLGSFESARTIPISQNITPEPKAFRWAAWLERDWESDDFSEHDSACLTGMAQTEELVELRNTLCRGSDNFLVYPAGSDDKLDHENRLFLEIHDEELEALFAL